MYCIQVLVVQTTEFIKRVPSQSLYYFLSCKNYRAQPHHHRHSPLLQPSPLTHTHTQHNTPPEPTKPRRVYLFSNMGFSGVPKKPPGLPVMGSKPHVFLDRNCWARIAARHRIKSSLCLNLSPSSLSW